jgi:hypothetical protein
VRPDVVDEQVHRHECDVPEVVTDPLHPLPFVRLRRRVIYLEPTHSGLAKTQRSGVITGTDKHNLINAITDGAQHLFVDEPGPQPHPGRT